MGEKNECYCNCGPTCGGKCDLDYLDCIKKHWVKDCGHDFTGWQIGKTENGGGLGTTVCSKCGITALGHDLLSAHNTKGN